VHRRLAITDEERDRFVALYLEALDESGPPDDEPLRRAVRGHVEFGARVAQQHSWARTDADLADPRGPARGLVSDAGRAGTPARSADPSRG
jgi:hypothetical protein